MNEPVRNLRRRILIAVVGGLFAAYGVGALVFGWQPGSLIIRPSMADCRASLGTGPGQVKSLDVAWVWAAKGFGWGCRATYRDGGSATATNIAGFADRKR